MESKLLTILKQKKGAMEIEEIIKILLAVLFLVVLVAAAAFLLGGKGGELLNGIKEAMRFG
ncbi:hypothetical protein HN747_01105 [archaeon]|jgi:hypothetical protein|nr:hypothetical protein [archaeon]